MRNGSITFQRSLFLSAGIHILIFGSALAFAQYTAGYFRHAFPVITVSLVGGSGGGGGAVRKASPETLPAAAARSMQSEPQHISEPAMSREEAPPSAVGEALSGTDEHGVTGPPGKGAAAGQPDPSGTNDGAHRGSSFSSEQWKQLQAAIEKAKTYPRLAREQGVEGVVLVRFKVAPSGDIEKVDVVRSSGSDILDQASVRTVRRAAPMPYLNGWVEVPMSYVLK